MSGDLSSASQCFGLYEGREIIGFCAIIHQPSRASKNIKRCHRLVILPDYQGIGLGRRFLNCVSDYYIRKGLRFTIVTTARNLIYALIKDEAWKMKSFAVNKPGANSGTIDRDRKYRKCKTARFEKTKLS